MHRRHLLHSLPRPWRRVRGQSASGIWLLYLPTHALLLPTLPTWMYRQSGLGLAEVVGEVTIRRLWQFFTG